MKSQQPPPPLLLPHAVASTAAHGRALQNLKSLLLKCAIASAPAKSLSLEHTTLIEKRIQESVPTIHTPDHPTYQWMIENAIKKLKEEGGCCDEGEISRFILKEHEDLPWAHDAFLNHHLNRLSRNGTITKSLDGCYSFGTPKPSPGPRPRPSPSSSPTSSSSIPTYASSDTSDSSWSSELKRRRKKKCNRRKRSQLQKQNVRGSITHPKLKRGRERDPKLKRGRERACARGRGRGRGTRGDNPCKEDMMEEACIGRVEGDECVDGMPTVEILCLSTDDEATDQRKLVPQAQANQDCVNHASREHQILRAERDACMDGMPMVEILCLLTDGEETDQRKQVPQAQASQDCVNHASQEHQIVPVERDVCMDGMPTVEILCLLTDMGGDCSTGRTIPSSRGSKKVRQQRRNIQSGQSRRGRGRPRKREMQDVNRVAQEDEDSMDALVDEVYNQLTKPTEIDGADVNLQREELPQADMNQEDTEMQNKIMDEQQRKEQNQRRKPRPRPTRNKSTNVADGSKSSNARPVRRREKVSALV